MCIVFLVVFSLFFCQIRFLYVYSYAIEQFLSCRVTWHPQLILYQPLVWVSKAKGIFQLWGRFSLLGCPSSLRIWTVFGGSVPRVYRSQGPANPPGLRSTPPWGPWQIRQLSPRWIVKMVFLSVWFSYAVMLYKSMLVENLHKLTGPFSTVDVFFFLGNERASFWGIHRVPILQLSQRHSCPVLFQVQRISGHRLPPGHMGPVAAMDHRTIGHQPRGSLGTWLTLAVTPGMLLILEFSLAVFWAVSTRVEFRVLGPIKEWKCGYATPLSPLTWPRTSKNKFIATAKKMEDKFIYHNFQVVLVGFYLPIFLVIAMHVHFTFLTLGWQSAHQ